MNMSQLYNKTITLFPPVEKENHFSLCSNVYNGKLTVIADHFNKMSVKECEELVQKELDHANHNRSCLQIASFLDYANIFTYLLSYKANPYHLDQNSQTVWHIIAYKGHVKLLNILLNYERFRIKMEALETFNNIKKSYGFSKLDIVNGKLSRAVTRTETNLSKFNSLQAKLRTEALNVITKFVHKVLGAFSVKDKEGRNPLHYSAMSKYPLCYLIVNDILNFDFFKINETWDEFLKVYEDIQYLEIKQERLIDPRRSLRFERELQVLLGDDIIKSFLSFEFKKMKQELFKQIINTSDNLGDTVLHLAAFHGDYRIVEKLIFNGGDKTALNNETKLPVDLAKDNFVRRVLTDLNKAAKKSDEKNITELVHFGHDINTTMTIFSQAPIHKIIESKKENKYTVLKHMLDMGADPNTQDSNGWTALHYAAEFGDYESATILVASNANVDSFSNSHRTPLHLASNMNFPNIVKFLLENQADPNYKDNQGCTPLHLAAKQGNVKCLEILLANKAELYCLDFRKWNILHYAAFNGHHKSVRFICKYDADYDVLQTTRNSQNKLAIEIVRDPSVKPYFITLWHAAREGNLDLTRQLLNEGENTNELTHIERNTPMHLAVMNNHYLMVRLLIENKAEIDIRNKEGLIPGDYASLMNSAITKLVKSSEELNKAFVDLRSIVMDVINKPSRFLNSSISKKNWKIRLWNVQDFNEKICKLLNQK